MHQRAGVKLHQDGMPKASIGGLLLGDKQDEKRIASPENVTQASSVASPPMFPLPHRSPGRATAPLLNSNSKCFIDVGPVELWATRWRRPSAAANPQGFCWPATPHLRTSSHALC